MSEDNIEKLFCEDEEGTFTVFVVEQRFATGRGAPYFKKFRGTKNYIETDTQLRKRIGTILKWINKCVPNSAELVQHCFGYTSPLSILDIVTSLSKLLSVHDHQAAGPEVIDPIIIQEGKVFYGYLKQVIALHKNSLLRPRIIIILKDNDFDRAKKILQDCPNGINIKFIMNNGKTEIVKVINCGAEDTESFLAAYAHQCFSTCSNTPRKILLNHNWDNNAVINRYTTELMEYRSAFLCENKTSKKGELTATINSLIQQTVSTENEGYILKALECIARLFRVYCNDLGGDDITTALSIARELNNKLLLAHVYRYAEFMPDLSFDQKLKLLDEAHDIFVEYKIEDHAIYSKNNRLIRQFDTDYIDVQQFRDLEQEAIYNVPGLVGMSRIMNNTGVAHIMTGYPEDAISFIKNGLSYSVRPDQREQKIALLCNQYIAQKYCFEKIPEIELRKTMNLIFDGMGIKHLPFISARYVMNILSIALQQDPSLAKDFVHEYPIKELIQAAFDAGRFGSGQLALQMAVLENKYPSILPEITYHPNQLRPVTGSRKRYIERYALNPFFFSTWL